LKITRLYTGSDNESHFEDIDIPLIDQGDIGKLSAKINATGLIFRETPPDYNFGWHHAPQRQYVVMLSGNVEIEIGDGTKRLFQAGDIILAEDTTGRGHQSRSLDDQPRKSLFITLD
jgi:uncharacterized cupin superfamily protein